MNWKISMLLVIALCTFPAISRSAGVVEEDGHKWQEYHKNNRAVVFYYEKDSVVFGADGVIKVWRKREFPIRSQQRSIIALEEIDCYKQQYRSVQLKVVNWDDTAETFDRVGDWSTIFSESPEEYFLDNVCTELKKKKKK